MFVIISHDLFVAAPDLDLNEEQCDEQTLQ